MSIAVKTAATIYWVLLPVELLEEGGSWREHKVEREEDG